MDSLGEKGGHGQDSCETLLAKDCHCDSVAREIANGLVDPLLVISPECKVILSNHASEARSEILDLIRFPGVPLLSQEFSQENRSLEFLVEYLRQEGIPLRYALVKASGEGFAYYYHLTATPVLRPDGSLACAVLSFQDCTARVNAERARLRSEAVYRAAIENASGVPYQLNARTGEYDFFGHGLEPLLGCAAKEINLKRFRELVRERVVADPEGPRDPFEYTAAFHRRAVRSYRMDVRIGTLEGEDKWLNDCALALWDESTGEMTGTVGILQDITARKRTEETCRQAKQTLNSILASATEFAIVTTDRAFRIIQYNPAAERIFALPVGQAIGREVEELNLREGILSCSFREAAECVLREGKWHCDSTIQEREGAERSFHAVMMPMQEEGGGCGGFVLFCWETTERLRLQTQLWRAQKMQAVGQLAGGVAHDFNNLLQVITGHLEFVQKALPPDGIVRQDLETARSATQRATVLTRQLLAFGRRQSLKRGRVDLNQVIVDFMKMLRRMIGEHIELEVILGQNIGPILADAGQMEQVLLNLCVNACDAMSEGGTIRIKTEAARMEPGEEPSPASHVLLSFSDTGHGMTPEVQEHIFEPFFTTKEQGKGTGLGLATVYGIVEQHEGTIQVHSRPAQGTSFRIFLPLAVPGEWAVEETRNESASGGQETLLIAEDGDQVRQLTARILRDAGYRVLEARHGEEALEHYRENRDAVRLVLLDVVMPKMGGGQASEEIWKSNPRTPILFFTGYSNETLEESDSFRNECAWMLRKPFTSGELLSRVREILDSEPAPSPGQEGE